MWSRVIAQSARSAPLSRAVAATGAPRALPSAISPSSASWARGMAKNSKPGQQPPRFSSPQSSPAQASPSKPAQTPPPQAPQPGAPAAAAAASSSSTGKPQEQPASKPAAEPAAEAEPEPESSLPDLSKLPDLTQGIPSTLEYETMTKERTSLTAAEQEEAAAGGRGKGELPASAYISSSERKRQKFANRMFATMAILAVGGTVYLGRDWDEEDLRRHPDVPNGWGVGLWWDRAKTRTSEVLSYYREPAFEKLLPDPDPMFERPYTLCISLEDMLLHSEWSREHGWRVAKRPGVDYFLHYLSQYYELVLFTSVPFAIGEPLVRKFDPFRFIVWPLYREATKYKDGEVVKDLSYLNRDLSKVIIIDSKASHVSAQPENAIVLSPWKGDPKDKELVGLIPFLEYIHTMQYSDVRKVLKSFEGKHIPTEFARREAIARTEFNKQLEAQKKKNPHRGAGGIAGLGSLLGLKPSNMSLMVMPEGEEAPSEAFAKGKMLQDIARERGQRNYELMEKEIRENGEKWLKEEAALQEKAQQEAMSSMKSSFTGWFIPSSSSSKPEEKPAEKN